MIIQGSVIYDIVVEGDAVYHRYSPHIWYYEYEHHGFTILTEIEIVKLETAYQAILNLTR